MEYPKDKLKKDWIQNGISKEAVDWANSFGEFLTEKNGTKGALSTSQIRKFFGVLRRIESDFAHKKNDIIMLKPTLAYAVGRNKNSKNQNKTKIKEFEEELVEGINAIRLGDEKHERNDFKNFLKICEAIVAYHKFYGKNE